VCIVEFVPSIALMTYWNWKRLKLEGR